MSIKIKINPIDLESQKVTEVFEGYFEFFDTHAISYFHFYANQPIDDEDEALGWDSFENHFKFIVLKKNVAGAQLAYACITSIWQVHIHILGFPEDLKAQFNKKQDAEEFFNKIQEWLLK